MGGVGVSNNSAGGSDSDTQDEAETGGPTGGPELVGRAKIFGDSRAYDFPKIWAKTKLG